MSVHPVPAGHGHGVALSLPVFATDKVVDVVAGSPADLAAWAMHVAATAARLIDDPAAIEALLTDVDDLEHVVTERARQVA